MRLSVGERKRAWHWRVAFAALGSCALFGASCGRSNSNAENGHAAGEGGMPSGEGGATAGEPASAGQAFSAGQGQQEEGGAGAAGAHGEAGAVGVGGAESQGQALAALAGLAQAFCEEAVECCSGHAQFPDVETCVDAALERVPVAAIFSGAVIVDQSKVELCTSAIVQAERCEPTPRTACSGIFVPARLPGQPCRDHRECVQVGDGVDCVLSGSESSVDGVCTAITQANAGEPCLATCLVADGPCEALTRRGETAAVCRLPEGLYCDTTVKSPTCKPTLNEGEKCGDYYSCGLNFRCYYDETLPGNPTICEGTYEVGCIELGCEGDLVCSNRTCAPPTNFDQSPGCGAGPLSY